jgi:hypothetical protein
VGNQEELNPLENEKILSSSKSKDTLAIKKGLPITNSHRQNHEYENDSRNTDRRMILMSNNSEPLIEGWNGQ